MPQALGTSFGDKSGFVFGNYSFFILFLREHELIVYSYGAIGFFD